MGFFYTLARIAKIEKTNRTRGNDLEQQEHSHSASGKLKPTLENS